MSLRDTSLIALFECCQSVAHKTRSNRSKHTEDVVTELVNKAAVIVPLPEYSNVKFIETRSGGSKKWNTFKYTGGSAGAAVQLDAQSKVNQDDALCSKVEQQIHECGYQSCLLNQVDDEKLDCEVRFL